MIALDGIALGTTAFMLIAGGIGLFYPPRHRDHTVLLARSWKRR